jgi:osmotically-inducible protein OsmY
MNDQDIKAEILMRIRRDSRISDGNVDVRVTNGLVQLIGSVRSYRKKLALQIKAKKTRGVISVDNRLSVVYPQELGNPSPSAIKQTAETVLVSNADIDVSKITVELESGVIILKGTVQFFWQLPLAEELVANIIGVNDVRNELTVVPSGDFSDETIASDIMAELAYSDQIDPDQILVEVNDGTVILSGTVKRYTAEREIYEAAIQQPGVRKVINDLVVAL